MWLLDVNLPNGLVGLLKKLGVETCTSESRGWRNLSNGQLAFAAHKAGFKVILTRDRIFTESAGKALKSLPDITVVIIRLPQSRQATYIAEFEKHWNAKKIVPTPGTVIEWP